MKAIILAAGRGSRLGALTEEQPKCLTPLMGTPLLEWQLQALRGAGLESIAIVRGYLAHRLEFPGLHYFENARWKDTNMVMSLVCAQEWLRQGPCIISYSDIVYPAETVSELLSGQGDLTITYDGNWLELWKLRFEDPLEDAETFQVNDQGQLLEIGNRAKTTGEIQGQYMGLLKITPTGWNRVERYLTSLPSPDQDRLDMTALLRGLLQSGVAIQTVPIQQRWYEVDTESDLQLYQALIEQRGGELWK